MTDSEIVTTPTLTDRESLAAGAGGPFPRLVRFAFANIRRRPERFILAVLGIALAIASVTVVRTISSSFAITGADSVTRAVGDATLWVVPSAGVRYDTEADALVAEGAPADIEAPAGWTATRTIAGLWDGSPAGDVAVYSSATLADGDATVGTPLADRLDLVDGDHLALGETTVTVSISGESPVLTTSEKVATDLVGDIGWWTVTEPPEETGSKNLGAVFGDATGLSWTADPMKEPDGQGLVYDTSAGGSALSFEQQYAGIFSGQVTNSALGLISTIGLVLGFVIAVSSFLASVQERRREFGIMSSIGLADEVLYFFLVESGIVFLAAWLLGISVAGLAVWLVIPSIATPIAWVQASAMVAGFLPAMAIVGALVPVHRLLQQRPVDLLGDR